MLAPEIKTRSICYVYVYAQNRAYRKIKVTVKCLYVTKRIHSMSAGDPFLVFKGRFFASAPIGRQRNVPVSITLL